MDDIVTDAQTVAEAKAAYLAAVEAEAGIGQRLAALQQQVDGARADVAAKKQAFDDALAKLVADATAGTPQEK